MDWPAFIQAMTGLVTAIGVIVVAYLQYRQKVKVEAVRTDLAEHTEAQDAAMAGLKSDVKEVHNLTNGMKTELVEAVRKEARAEGVKSETDKHQGL